MDRDLIRQTLRPAFWSAAVLAAALYGLTPPPVASGFLAGALWNVLNLFLLRAVGMAFAREQGRRTVLLLLLKVFILYPLGLALIMSEAYSVLGVLAGFSWTFVVMIVLAIWPARPPKGQPAHEVTRG